MYLRDKEIIEIVGTPKILLQWKRRNPPLSIAAGTILYMLLLHAGI